MTGPARPIVPGWKRTDTGHLAEREPRQRQTQEACIGGRAAGQSQAPWQMGKLRPREVKGFTKAHGAQGSGGGKLGFWGSSALHSPPLTSTCCVERQTRLSPCSSGTPGQTPPSTCKGQGHRAADQLRSKPLWGANGVALPLCHLMPGENRCPLQSSERRAQGVGGIAVSCAFAEDRGG